MKYCMRCGKANDNNAKFCIACGSPMQQQANTVNQPTMQYPYKKSTPWFFIPGGIAAFWLLGSVAMFSNSEEPIRDRIFGGFFFLMLSIAFVGACIFLYFRYRKDKKSEEEFIQYLRLATENQLKQQEILKHEAASNRIIEKEEKKLNKISRQVEVLKQEKRDIEKTIASLQTEELYEVTKIEVDEAVTSEEYKNRLNILQLEEKQIIQNEDAIKILKAGDDKLQRADKKQILRCFQSEFAVIFSGVTVKNVDASRNKVMRSFDAVNKIFVTDGVALSQKLLENKLEQLAAKYQYEYQKEQERLQQKAIREQMIEEEKARREIEREKEKLSKEETQFKNEIEKLMKYMQKSQDIEKQLYISQIEELQKKLAAVQKDKEDVLHREQNTRAGFVYIISNIGSFGEDIYKIGMTRRLEPMERISELSSASVPFEFDVHAMIFSDDAPALESILHNTFADKRVNLVNSRKEFFHVSLDEIESVVKKNYNATVTFTKIAEAAQYRESLRLRESVNVQKRPTVTTVKY